MERRHTNALALFVCLTARFVALRAGEAAAVQGDFARLVALRDGLRKAFENRQAADSRLGPTRHFHLYLDEGADRDELHLVLRLSGSRWRTAYGEVPAWRQGTMQEWRSFHLMNGAGAAWRPNLRFPVDTGALESDGGRLSGRLAVGLKLDQTLAERLPPGEPVSWWDRFISSGHAVGRTQSFAIDAVAEPDAFFLDLVLEGGVHWKPKKRRGKQPPIVVRPIVVRLRVPGTRFSPVQVQTPTWNGGFHEGDATKLRLAKGRLEGELLILLHQDGWLPWGGKTRQHAPQVLRFQLDAALRHNSVSGSFKASGDMGDYGGAVRGRGGRAVAGRFRAQGELGEQVGALHGMLLDDPAPARELVSETGDQTASAFNAVLHHIRALHLALQHHPLPLAEALAQTDVAAPVWGQDPDPARLAAYCCEALALVSRAPSPSDPAPRVAHPEGTGGSPSLGVAAASVEEGDVNVLAPGGGWQFLPRWSVLGPFEQRIGLDHNDALVPEIVPLAGLRYSQSVGRFGARRADAPEREWQPVACAGPRLGAPWDKPGFYSRFAGQVWYGVATARREKAGRAWLSLEAGDHAKLWVNGRLVWVDTEKPWRCRARGRVVVPVELRAGANQFLVRVHRDRDPSWIRLAVSGREPASGKQSPAAPGPGPRVFPDATPPLAWDIDKGINVAWRRGDLAGTTRPLLVGDALVLTSRPRTLHCLDAASGKPRWSREAKAPAALPEGRDGRELRVSDPVSEGRRIWFHAGASGVTCVDLRGKVLWQQGSDLRRAKLHLHGGRLVVEGDALASWPLPQGMRGLRAGKKRAPVLGVLLLDAAAGKVQGRWTLVGSLDPGASHLLSRGGAAALLTSTGALIDVVGRRMLGGFDVEYPGPSDADYQKGAQILGGRSGRPFGLCANGQAVFLTNQAQSLAVRLWARDGRIAYAHLWESNYEHTGFGSFAAPSVATDRYVFSSAPVLERGPHCPDARLELHVQDARTGRPLARLKPVLENAVHHEVAPVVAGRYVFCLDAGGGSHGGHPTHGQIAIATADGQLQLVCRNLIELGTRVSPVFAADRMVLRSPSALTCIAVTTDQGRRYQAQQLARVMLAEVGPAPTTAAPRDVEPMEKPPVGADVPTGKLLDGRASEHWLGAGPLAAEAAGDEAALAALRPCPGTTLATATFRPLSREHAFNDPPRYERQYVLQGTGDIVPFFSTRVDPRCVSGRETGAGLLYTGLDNTRDRIVVPTLKARGVTQWLGGRRLRPDEPLHLRPGLYPYLLRVEPSYYEVAEKEEIPPVAVAKALAAKALSDIQWPATWQVLGPLPADTPPLTPEVLRGIPRKVTVGDRDYPAFAIPADGTTLYLTSLLGLRPGQKPDVAGAPKTVRIGTPSLAWCFAAVECPADGTLYVTMGGDWFTRWRLDGRVIYDTMKSGNGAAPIDVKAHPFAVRVTKGRHVLAAAVRPGSKGWSLSSLGGFSARPPEALADFHVPPRQKKAAPDHRLAPAFKEIPHPRARMARWRKRLDGRRAQLEAILRHLPGTDEAEAAESLLAR